MRKKSALILILMMVMIIEPLLLTNSFLTVSDKRIMFPQNTDESGISMLETSEWGADGTVICNLSQNQGGIRICSDGLGGAIIIWQDWRNGPQSDIYAQRINSIGSRCWTANGVPICTANGNQEDLQICSDGAGGAIITWDDYRSGSYWKVYAQRIDSFGSVQWTINGVLISNTSNHQVYPQICRFGLGGAVITWEDYRSGDGYADIYAQHVNVMGTLEWTATGVAICAEYINFAPQICNDGSGGTIITWECYRSGSLLDIYAQRISSVGIPQWTANGVAICTAVENQKAPRICSDDSGGAIIAWIDPRSGIYHMYTQRVNSTGFVQWATNGEVIFNAGDLTINPAHALCKDGSGGVIITWPDPRGASWDIYAQHISSAGTPQWTANGVAICTANNNQLAPMICEDGSGGAIITWMDERNGPSDPDIYAQRINLSGLMQWTANGVAFSAAGNKQTNPQICSDGAGGAILSWQDNRSGNYDIYAQWATILELDIGKHLENGQSVPPGVTPLDSNTDLNITISYKTRIDRDKLTWTNISIFYKINQDNWRGPFYFGYGYGNQISRFLLKEGNYSKFDKIYYFLAFHQCDNSSNILRTYYWTQDGVKLDLLQAKSAAFHKTIGPILFDLTLDYSVWYKAQVKVTIPYGTSGINITRYPWVPIVYENISLDFNNLTSAQTNFSVSCINELKLDHSINEQSSNISKSTEPLFEYNQGIKSPFVLPLNLTLIDHTTVIRIPQLLYDSVGSQRNLTFTGTVLNLTYRGLENWPNPHRIVLKFSADYATVRYSAFTGIMEYYEYCDDTVNASKKIILGLIGNNKSFPIDLEVEKRSEINATGTFIIPQYLFEIIYDPPGDQSYSQVKAGTSVSYGVNVEMEKGLELYAESEFLVAGVGSGMDMSVGFKEKEGYDIELEITYEKTMTSSINSEDPLLVGPGRGDLYYGAGIIVEYNIILNNYYIVINERDAPNNWLDDIKVFQNGSRIEYGLNISSQFSILGAYLDQYGLSNLSASNIFADNNISSVEKSFVEKCPDSPFFWTPNYITELMYSYTKTVTETRSMTFELSLDTYMCWNIPISGSAGVGVSISWPILEASGKVGIGFDYSMTRTATSATEENREILCHLEDDDGSPIGQHDQFLMDIYRDLRYNTFGYIYYENSTYTSRPYEIGTRDHRNPTISELLEVGDYVHGTIPLKCAAVDEETGVNHVKYYYDNDPIFDVDSIQIGYQTTPIEPNLYQLMWNTSLFHGTYYLFAVTYDNAVPLKKFTVSDAFLIHIDNVLPSICQIRVYEPYCAAISLYANTFDADSGVESVDYWDGAPGALESSLLGTSYDTSSSFKFIWTTDPLGSNNGIHLLFARAYDRAGNYRDSSGFEMNVTTHIDSDQDNLYDDLELIYGTDPHDSDTDNDGLPDGWEVTHLLNASNAVDAQSDLDEDNLTNVEEFNQGTDPNDPDSDDDLLPDKWEVEHALSPINSLDASLDFDGDGLTNLQEYIWNTGIYIWDSDMDSFADGVEVAAGTDPLDISSYPSSQAPQDNSFLVVSILIAGIAIAVALLVNGFFRRTHKISTPVNPPKKILKSIKEPIEADLSKKVVSSDIIKGLTDLPKDMTKSDMIKILNKILSDLEEGRLPNK